MPDLKDKYSDPELDRSNKAFEEMVNSPENQAFNDQADAVARDLQSAENQPSRQAGVEDADSKEGVKNAEDNNGTAPENPYNYTQPEKNSGLSARVKSWSNRKKLAVFGGAGGGIIGALIAGSFMLSLKVPGLLSTATNEAGQRVEQITEQRAKLILARAILTKFGTHTGIVITGEGAFKSLVASMRTSGFEKRLAAKGLTISTTPDGVKLFQNGKPLGNGRSLKNEQDVLKILEGDKVTNKALKQIIKEDIPGWRWMKRAKFAKWLRIKYGIPRYGLKNSDKKDPKDREKDLDSQRVKAANARMNVNFRELLDCILSGRCDKIEGKGEPTKVSEADGQKTADDVAEAAKNAEEEVLKKGLKGAQTTATKLLLTKVGSRAIPIVGWIDLVASIDHLVYKIGHEDYLGKIASYYKGASYAAVYAEWSGYASQTELGALDPRYVGVLSDELDGAEKAQAFRAIQGDPTSGVPISLKVNSDKPSEVAELYKNIVRVNPAYELVSHPLLNLYYETAGSGGLLGWLGGLFAKVLSALFEPIFSSLAQIIGIVTPESVKEKLLDAINALGPKMLEMFGLTLDAFEKGAGLMNNIIGGALVSWNAYCKEVIGCRALTSAQAYTQDQSIAAEKAEYRNEKGLAYALFSRDEPRSLTSQFASSIPTTPLTAMSSVGTTITSATARLFGLITPGSVKAAGGTTYESLFAIKPYGATQADINRPLSEQFLRGDKCPDNSDDNFNDCAADTVVAEAMRCEFTPDEDGCGEDSRADSSSSSGASIVVATFNIFHSDDQSETVWSARLKRSIQVLKDNNVGVAGLQEVRPNQMAAFNTAAYAGDLYEMYPKALKNPDFSPNPIIWKKGEFTLIKTSSIPFTYFGGMKDKAPLVRLKHNVSGREFYVINTHDPADTRGEADKYRYENAVNYVSALRQLASEGLPIFFTGDFNSGYDLKTGNNNTYQDKRENLTYCVLTDSTGFWDAYDASKQKQGMCPSKEVKWQDNFPGGSNPIDHIFLSDKLAVDNFWRSPAGREKNGSDTHDTIMAEVTIAEDPATTEAGSWSWPVDESGWKSDGQRWLEPHTAGSQAWTNSMQAAADINIGSGNDDCGRSVYSMLGGSVIPDKDEVPSTSNYIMQVRSKVNGKDVIITYAHGKNMKQSGTVKPGQKIMEISNNSRYGGSCHLHLEIKYGNKAICPQDIFPLMAKKEPVDLDKVRTATSRCAG